MPRESQLVQALVEVADNLVTDFDVVELLTVLSQRCVEVLDVGAAGLMLAGTDGQLRLMASSDEAMRLLEVFELQAEEGPCLDAYRTGMGVTNIDLADARDRWPLFAPAAEHAGYRVVHALPMRLRGTVLGSLNLFHVHPSRMTAADLEAAQALADIATISILQHRAAVEAQLLAEQLSQALNSRVVIEQAKGVLAERDGLDMDEAFAALRSHSRNHNRRLSDVAQDVVTGRLTTLV